MVSMTHAQDFLHDEEPESFQHAHRRTRIVRTIFVFCLTAIVLWIVLFLTSVIYITTNLFDARDQILAAETSLETFAFDQARASFEEARHSLASAHTLLPLLRSGAWLPFIGDTIDSFSMMIASSQSFIQALTPLTDLGADLVRLSGLSEEYLREVREGISPTVTFDDLSQETKRAVLKRLSASADELDLLVVEMNILQEEMELLSSSAPIAPLLTLLDPLIDQLEVVRDPIELLAIGARLLPAFAGLDDPASILLLFLNNDELRPGGGFIGSYGVLEMSQGDIAHLETADVYALDHAVEGFITRAAPSPLQRYNATSTWFFRDSNWSPDFSVSASQAIEMFLEEVGFLNPDSSVPTLDHVEHVIGFTPTFASALLQITGPIELSGQVFTSENVADALEYQVEQGYAEKGVPEAQRKEILADLVNEMKSHLYALQAKQWPDVLAAIREALSEKQLLLFSTDEGVQRILTAAGWGGVLEASSPDTLMVVDANLASLKSDPVVNRHILYELYQNTTGQWLGRVSIRYTHTGDFDWKTTRYRTYTRVYLPQGTRFLRVPIGAEDPVDIEDELGFTSFGAFTSIEPGDERTLIFEFELAPQVVESMEKGEYALTVLKQAGARNHALTFDLDFDKNVTHATPAENPNEWGDDVYRLNTILDQDVVIDVDL